MIFAGLSVPGGCRMRRGAMSDSRRHDQGVKETGRNPTREEFICEQLRPRAGTGSAVMASHREPGLPTHFIWRDETYEVVGLIEAWKTDSPCRHGGGEMYLRRHWYRIRVRRQGPCRADDQAALGPVDQARTPEACGGSHRIVTIYCDRQAKSGRKPKSRWWVYTAGPAYRRLA